MNVLPCIPGSNEAPQRSVSEVLWTVGALYCQSNPHLHLPINSFPQTFGIKRSRHIPAAPHMSFLRAAKARRRRSGSSLPSVLPPPAADGTEMGGLDRARTHDRSRTHACEPLASFRTKPSDLGIVQRQV